MENGFKRSERREIRNGECKVQSERERQVSYDITYMWTLNYGTNELISKTETDSQTERADMWFPRGRWVEEGRTGCLGLADVNCYI